MESFQKFKTTECLKVRKIGKWLSCTKSCFSNRRLCINCWYNINNLSGMLQNYISLTVLPKTENLGDPLTLMRFVILITFPSIQRQNSWEEFLVYYWANFKNHILSVLHSAFYWCNFPLFHAVKSYFHSIISPKTEAGLINRAELSSDIENRLCD